MLLDFNKLFEKYGLKIKGVLHIGAHHGQEYETYANKGIRPILFFEPLKENFEKLKSYVQHAPFTYLHNYALGNKEGKIKMNVEHANQGQSSSILNPKKHLKHYPDITFKCNIWVMFQMLFWI